MLGHEISQKKPKTKYIHVWHVYPFGRRSKVNWVYIFDWKIERSHAWKSERKTYRKSTVMLPRTIMWSTLISVNFILHSSRPSIFRWRLTAIMISINEKDLMGNQCLAQNLVRAHWMRNRVAHDDARKLFLAPTSTSHPWYGSFVGDGHCLWMPGKAWDDDPHLGASTCKVYGTLWTPDASPSALTLNQPFSNSRKR